ncbi:hypothetical protein ACEN2T_18070 [Pseudomonas sp. W22_MBD1_FP4]|uniref:hypothetical protein n=1 Tax=Pseudomonas sp. W22_MBD1_FP4 TaxID=3240272 RepID=UPI003F94EA27
MTLLMNTRFRHSCRLEMKKNDTPVELCAEAVALLKQHETMRLMHGDTPPPKLQLLMDQMAMTAENLAGEAGALAARLGMANQTPGPAQKSVVLTSAFRGSYILEEQFLRA